MLELRLQNPLSHETYTFNCIIIHTFSLKTLLCGRCKMDLLWDKSRVYRVPCFFDREIGKSVLPEVKEGD